ncbi:branched-chain amino acid ABC transporter permease [Moorellaceae bacterium AZ2]
MGSSTAKLLLAVTAVVVFPFIVSDYWLHIGIMVGLWILLASSMNLILGYIGQTPLGHTAFWGIGGFAAGLLSVKMQASAWFSIPAAILIAGFAGYLIGYCTLRLRGAYFVLASLGFAEVLRLVALNWVEVTGGPMGFPGIPPVVFSVPGIGKVELTSPLANYLLIWSCVGITLLVIWRIINSRIGRALVAISESELLAESVGIDVYSHSMGIVVLSAGIAGLAGALYAHYITFISPDMFYLANTITMLVMVMVGGRRTFGGPIIGAVIFTVIPELLRAAEQFRMIAYGITIILGVLYFPDGVLSMLTRLANVLKIRQDGGRSFEAS